jgi:hypothetical protein
MAGIFPAVGADPANTQNAISPTLVAGCKALFYPQNCNPRFDPLATNAIMSELLNAINLGKSYDCNRLDNLKQALQNFFNICGLPGHVAAAADYVAGCFGGGQGLANVQQLLDLAPNIYPTGNYDGNEFIAASENGGPKKFPVSQLVASILSQVPQPPAQTSGRWQVNMIQEYGPNAPNLAKANHTWPYAIEAGLSNGNLVYHGGMTLGNGNNSPASFPTKTFQYKRMTFIGDTVYGIEGSALEPLFNYGGSTFTPSNYGKGAPESNQGGGGGDSNTGELATWRRILFSSF